MERYIQQLIEDFNWAEEEGKQKENYAQSLDDDLIFFEITEGDMIPAKQKVGVSYEELPPANRMTTEQTQDLLEAMLNALSANGTEVTFPGSGIPVKLCYTELRKHFKEGFYAIPGWVIDFCRGNCSDCAFADYCTVKDEFGY